MRAASQVGETTIAGLLWITSVRCIQASGSLAGGERWRPGAMTSEADGGADRGPAAPVAIGNGIGEIAGRLALTRSFAGKQDEIRGRNYRLM
jgi:hypothetical protein